MHSLSQPNNSLIFLIIFWGEWLSIEFPLSSTCQHISSLPWASRLLADSGSKGSFLSLCCLYSLTCPLRFLFMFTWLFLGVSMTGGALQWQRGEDRGQPQRSLWQIQRQACHHQGTWSVQILFWLWLGFIPQRVCIFCLFFRFLLQPICLLITDFSDRISKSRRVGYESGEFEIVSTFCSAEIHCFTFYSFRSCSILRVTMPSWFLLNSLHAFSDKVKSLRWCDRSCQGCSLRTRLTLLLCNIHTISRLSYLCLARRGLWSEGDAPAEVPAPGERDPGTHSGGGFHPGELIARHTHTCAQTHFSLAHSTWQGMVHSVYPAFIFLSTHKFNSFSQRDFPHSTPWPRHHVSFRVV